MTNNPIRSTSDVRVGIVGCGNFGSKWISLFQKCGAHVTACCDADPRALERAATSSPHAGLFSDVISFLKGSDVNAVYVATPVDTHFTVAKSCIEAGKNVLVEKPLSTTSGEAAELTRLARENNVTLMSGNTFVYNRAIQAVAEAIQSGRIGPIRSIFLVRSNPVDIWGGKTFKSYDSVLWDLGPHEVSVLLMLIGRTPSSVVALSTPGINRLHTSPLVDAVTINMRFPRNIIAEVHLRWFDYSKERRLIVFGQKGIIALEDPSSRSYTSMFVKTFQIGDSHVGEIGSETRQVYVGDTLESECKHFIDCLVGGNSPITDGQNGTEVVRVLEAAQQSIQLGSKWQDLGGLPLRS